MELRNNGKFSKTDQICLCGSTKSCEHVVHCPDDSHLALEYPGSIISYYQFDKSVEQRCTLKWEMESMIELEHLLQLELQFPRCSMPWQQWAGVETFWPNRQLLSFWQLYRATLHTWVGDGVGTPNPAPTPLPTPAPCKDEMYQGLWAFLKLSSQELCDIVVQ